MNILYFFRQILTWFCKVMNRLRSLPCWCASRAAWYQEIRFDNFELYNYNIIQQNHFSDSAFSDFLTKSKSDLFFSHSVQTWRINRNQNNPKMKKIIDQNELYHILAFHSFFLYQSDGSEWFCDILWLLVMAPLYHSSRAPTNSHWMNSY